LSEDALHVPARRRFTPHAEVAGRIAQEAGGAWSTARVRAGDGAALEAWQFQPRQWNGGTVLVLHGHLDTREGTSTFASMLMQHGYAALVPDNRGHGSSGGAEVTYGIRERDDIRSWVGWALSSGHARRVYGLGESMGAANLLQSLPVEPRFRAVVAEGAFTGFRRVAYERVGRRFGMPPGLSGILVEPAFLYVRLRYGLPLADANPLDAVRQSHTPVLYIHGTSDTNITPDNSRLLYETRSEASELWQPEGATHTRASLSYPEEFERRVIGWFDTH
jgi:alpha-beta hydrolase superfamily lysophospholipase